MTTLNDFHSKAMDLADEAFGLLRKGENDRAQALFLEALGFEVEAASLLPPAKESEPSRSVLYRSAASLAFNAGDYETAERLVGHGLSGFPPPEVREELKVLYENINSKTSFQPQRVVTQEEINYGQRQLNYYLTQADFKVIEALRTVVDTLEGLRADIWQKERDLTPIQAAIDEADETVKRLADIRPPGCEGPHESRST